MCLCINNGNNSQIKNNVEILFFQEGGICSKWSVSNSNKGVLPFDLLAGINVKVF